MMKLLWVVVVVVALLVGEMGPVAAASCNAVQLSPCFASIRTAAAPSSLCCSRLKQQLPCLCGYMKDPALQKYVKSPNAKKVASTCGIHIPSC